LIVNDFICILVVTMAALVVAVSGDIINVVSPKGIRLKDTFVALEEQFVFGVLLLAGI
jgi:hypothetical protein